LFSAVKDGDDPWTSGASGKEQDLETRMETVECKLMDAEDQIEALNRTVFRQQQCIERLERQLIELRAMVMERLSGQRLKPEDEIPPHY